MKHAPVAPPGLQARDTQGPIRFNGPRALTAGITKRVGSSCRTWITDRAGRLYLCRRCPTACPDRVFDILDIVV